MEQFVLGIFQEHLAKFIIGFRKEQVNANLLNGKGEITDIHLNCTFINEILATLTPIIELESVHLSKLSFHVTAWSNLKKAPIVIDIEDVEATIVEPLSYLSVDKGRRVAQQLSREELTRLIQQGLHRLRNSYNLFDRILDNMRVEIRSVNVTFQARGKFKTKRTGPWTPPMLVTKMKHVKYVSVDEYGEEGTPEQVWRHNRHAHKVPMAERTIMIYKKLTLEMSLGLRNPLDPNDEVILLQEAEMEVHLCFLKRLRDAGLLSIQMDTTFTKVDVEVHAEAVPMLAHAAAGLQYCTAKDRAFDDPLVKKSEKQDENEDVELYIREETKNETEENVGTSVSVVIPEDPTEDSSSESDADSSQSSKREPPSRIVSSIGGRDRPVILLPNGLVIHEKISFSLSMHQCNIRGVYAKQHDGHVKLVMKGFITEMIWPKATREKGGYSQISVSFVSLQEKHGKRIRTILTAGVQHDINKLPLGLPGKPRPEKSTDESFPLFEERSVRPDPFGLRHTFPEQAFGIKTTVSYIDKVSNPYEDEIMVLHEVGVSQANVLVDTGAWSRAIQLAVNEDNGFDPRWHSGDWSDVMTTDMLVSPTEPLNLADHVQPTAEFFLDENSMISSDLLNMTARIMNVEIRVPAAVHEDVRSCDIVLAVSETMLVVSSALPRTFLTGKVGSSIHGDGKKSKDQIDFPNDPSDICYSMEESEDPSIRQRGTMTSKAISTFRSQLTIRGFACRIIPVIPFCDANGPQQLVEELETTMIICFEGEPPESPESNLIKIVLFLSVQIHRLHVNLDLDIIAGAVSTLLHHAGVIKETATAAEDLCSPVHRVPECSMLESPTSYGFEHDATTRMSKTLKNRRVLVKRQIARSRETGGLSVSMCMQMAEFNFQLWRQNVPLSSPFRASLGIDGDAVVDDTPIASLKLVTVGMKDLEIGLEWAAQMSHRRVVLKSCLSELKMSICDFEAECIKFIDERLKDTSGANNENAGVKQNQESVVGCGLIELLTFGSHAHAHRSYAEVASGHNDILIRAEEHLDSGRSMSLACEVGPPGVAYARVREAEAVCLLLIEALLLPTGVREERLEETAETSNHLRFPARSVGALLSWLICKSVGEHQAKPPSTPRLEKNNPVGEIDKLVHSVVENRIPKGVHTLVARLVVVDILVFVPDKAPPSETIDKSKWLGLVVHHTNLLSGFFASKGKLGTADSFGIMSELASSGTTWSSILDTQDRGLHAVIGCRPSLYAAVRKDSICVTTESLVSEFEVTCSYHPTDVSVSMGDSTLLVKDLDNLNHLYCSLTDMADQGRHAMSTINAVVDGLSCRPLLHDTVEETSETKVESRSLNDSFVFESFAEAEISMQGMRASLTKLREASEIHSLKLRDFLRAQQGEIDLLRYEVFTKERARLSAVALVYSQVSGWLRMGGTHTYGTRVSGVTTMWRYYFVLRKSLLLVLPAPGQPNPVDIIVLDGANLRPLAGGRRKRDVQRGFSIIDSAGIARFFVAESGSEYEKWIRAIDMVIRASRTDDESNISMERSVDASSGRAQEHGGKVPVGIVISEHDSREEIGSVSDWDTLSVGEEFDASTPAKRAVLRQRLSAVTASTKNKLGSATASTKSKLGSATASTKSKLGSAVQAARQKASSATADGNGERSVISDTQEGGATEQSGHSALSNPIPLHKTLSSEGYDEGSVDSNGVVNQSRRMGGRFAAMKAGTTSRFGSVVQAAAARQRASKAGADTDLSVGQPAFASEGHEEDSVGSDQSRRMSGRFAAMKTGTKNRFGSALQVAKEKGKAAADHSRRKLQRDSEQRDARDLGSQQSEPVIVPAEHDSQNEFSQSENDDFQSEDLRSQTSTNTDQDPITPSSSARRSQLKEKFGAAVQSVRRSSQNGTAQDEDEGPGKFSFRRRKATDGTDPMKLRGIYIGQGNPADHLVEASFFGADVPLQKIEGHWLVTVEACEVSSRSLTPSVSRTSLEVSQSLSPVKETEQEEYHSNSSEAPQPLSSLDESQQEMGHSEDGDLVDVPVTPMKPKEAPETLDSSRRPSLSDLQLRLEQGFRINVLSTGKVSGGEEKVSREVKEVVRSLSDVVALHTTLSECIGRVGSAAFSKISAVTNHVDDSSPASLAARFDMTPLDIVRVTGGMLAGLLEACSDEIEDSKAYNEYRGEIVKEFLNSIMDCPLPHDGLEAFSSFLDEPSILQASPICDSTLSATVSYTARASTSDETTNVASKASTKHILACAEACESDLLRAEAQARRVRQLIETEWEEVSSKRALDVRAVISRATNSSTSSSRPVLEPLLPFKIVENLQDAMHGALINVMAERDESHAQLIAASVLNMHEMEQERKKVERLNQQLRSARAFVNSTQPGARGSFLSNAQTTAQEEQMK